MDKQQYETYDEVVDYILSIPKFAKKIGTENLLRILENFGHPERKVPCIHVAGTNGKGSTCAFLQSVYHSAGWKTGLFTSPHLVKLNERIKIDGISISDEDFVRLFKRVQDGLEVQDVPYPSFFEMMFLMAALWFAEQKVDIAIYETGMGGRLDATNVLMPALCVITSVGLDHMQYLGDTIEKIAFEKAGIIKENTPVVTFLRDKAASEVIRQQAQKLHAPFYVVEKENYMINKITTKMIDFSIDCEYYKCDAVQIPRTGLYQVENAVLAMAAVAKFPGLSVSDEEIRQGLWDMRWEGRMEELLPDIFIDGAHNDEAVLVWVKTVKQLFGDRRKRLLFAVANDKNYIDMIHHICQDMHYEKIYITTIPGARKTSVLPVMQQFQSCCEDELEMIEDTKTAFMKAKDELQQGETLFLVGSLYLAGAVKSYIE